MRSFMKIKPSRNAEIPLLFNDVGKSCPSCEFLMRQICLFIAVPENKILAKSFEFTVLVILKGITHAFSCIKVCQVLRNLFEHRA